MYDIRFFCVEVQNGEDQGGAEPAEPDAMDQHENFPGIINNHHCHLIISTQSLNLFEKKTFYFQNSSLCLYLRD